MKSEIDQNQQKMSSIWPEERKGRASIQDGS